MPKSITVAKPYSPLSVLQLKTLLSIQKIQNYTSTQERSITSCSILANKND